MMSMMMMMITIIMIMMMMTMIMMSEIVTLEVSRVWFAVWASLKEIAMRWSLRVKSVHDSSSLQKSDMSDRIALLPQATVNTTQ